VDARSESASASERLSESASVPDSAEPMRKRTSYHLGYSPLIWG
jgi:hypothetical protein